MTDEFQYYDSSNIILNGTSVPLVGLPKLVSGVRILGSVLAHEFMEYHVRKTMYAELQQESGRVRARCVCVIEHMPCCGMKNMTRFAVPSKPEVLETVLQMMAERHSGGVYLEFIGDSSGMYEYHEEFLAWLMKYRTVRQLPSFLNMNSDNRVTCAMFVLDEHMYDADPSDYREDDDHDY